MSTKSTAKAKTKGKGKITTTNDNDSSESEEEEEIRWQDSEEKKQLRKDILSNLVTEASNLQMFIVCILDMQNTSTSTFEAIFFHFRRKSRRRENALAMQ
jgi:hypothetical protein